MSDASASTGDLLGWIEERIDADTAISDEVGLLVLAALEGEQELDEYLATGKTVDTGATSSPQSASSRAATGAFLRSIGVAGFRGIGAPVTLVLDPSPGLTVVAGRNGSGKSSIAEGLELLLTGGTYRWKNKKSMQWAERWRNLHHDGQAEILAEVIEEGTGPVRLRTRWMAGTTDVHDHVTTAQRTVEGVKGPAEDVATLGWTSALTTFRPMLSYDELGRLLEGGPSELYDAISKILGTEQLADALARIKSRLTQLAAPQKVAGERRKTLQTEADQLGDERAQAVATLLRKTAPDTAKIRELATGVTSPDHGVIGTLRTMSRIEAPDAGQVAAAAQRLRRAVASMAEAGEAEAGRRVARLDLRRRALVLHAEHGDQSCPVCTTGTLDQAWVRSSEALVAREDAELRHLMDARNELVAARQSLRSLIWRRPDTLDRPPVPELEVAVASARTVWDDVKAAPDSDSALADHLELHSEELGRAVAGVRTAAAKALETRDDAWAPLAARIAAWCQEWTEALVNKPLVDHLAAAEKWLKANDTRLKNERIAPISGAARQAWSVLRQESNVDIGELRLEGAATRRRVNITATIDGADAGSALPVMSQGELHALTLALFLPRATLDESPFRFLILDDPVQAMDPAKVDGLVALLSEIATSRQVIVFSHDDRFPAALRRINSSARIYEVVRGADSTVTISAAEDPATRYLSDAYALCRDDGVPDQTLRRTLPGLLRMAIESAARDRFYAVRLTRGTALAEVEQAWNSAHGTRQRLSLAIYDTVQPIDGWLRTESHRKALGVATSGFHQGLAAGSPSDAVYHARRTVDDIRSGSR